MNKADLARLQALNAYVFHGSLRGDIQELTPRQAYSHGKPDGKPCIAASERIEPPVFMAILGARHVGGWGRGEIKHRGQFGFYADRENYECAKREQWSGYVYVLNKSDFEPTGAWEWRAYQPVKPVAVIAVNSDDLPPEIMITDN